jgi:hypothetical protein
LAVGGGAVVEGEEEVEVEREKGEEEEEEWLERAAARRAWYKKMR